MLAVLAKGHRIIDRKVAIDYSARFEAQLFIILCATKGKTRCTSAPAALVLYHALARLFPLWMFGPAACFKTVTNSNYD